MPCAPSLSARLRRPAPRFTTPRSRSCVGLFRSKGSKDQRSRAAFRLPNPSGRRPVSLAGLRRGGPAVVTFYRGGWCPYCNLQLRAYQQVVGEITRLGAKLVAISPQLPKGSMSTAEINRLSFDVLGDIGNR